MTEIVLIAAVAKNRVIGRAGAIPWRISEDFRRFKRLTLGHPCIMGEATYRSLPAAFRPLPGRENIVLTLDPGYRPPGATVLHAFEDAIDYVRRIPAERAFIVGGASIYRLGLDLADTLELTELCRDYQGDVYFPEFDREDFELVSRVDSAGTDELAQEPIRYSFATYRRRSRRPLPPDSCR